MRSYYSASDVPGLSGGLPKAVKTIIIANAAVFVLIFLFRGFPWFSIFGLVPRYVLGRGMLWQAVTYLFVHAGVWHLAINMLMLWMFGSAIESAWGTKEFVKYFLLTGIGAAGGSVVFAFGSRLPVLGASGAIFGILTAYAILFPDNIILVFFLFPMKVKHAVLVFAGINLLSALSAPGNAAAYLAQLAGGLCGYIYLKNERLRFFWRSFGWSSFRARSGAPRRGTAPKPEPPSEDAEVDAILDKISRHGMQSLTRKERAVLERKSRKSG